MRISPNDRRLFNRRLRDRLPRAIQSLFKRTPTLVLVVTATFVVTPEAWAKIVGNKAVPVMTLESARETESPKLVEKTYSKDELKKTLPTNPVVTLNDRIAGEVTALLQRMAAQQGGENQVKAVDGLKTVNPDDTNYFLSIAAMRDAPKARASNGDNLRAYLAAESQKAGTERVKQNSQLLQKISSGLNFNLDVAEIFRDSPQKQVHSGSVRYGLILEDIKPADKAVGRAAINADIQDELEFAGHADVKWTIGPVEEEHKRKVWDTNATDAGTPGESRIKIPKAAFSGRILPENVENLSSVKGSGALPNWNLELYQTEQVYKLNYKTKASGEKISAEHTLLLPVTGNLAIGRRFNDRFEVLQTSAYNVLIDKRMPLVSVHYWTVEQRYSSDVGYQFGKSRVSASARGKAEGSVANEADRPEQYSVNYTRDL